MSRSKPTRLLLACFLILVSLAGASAQGAQATIGAGSWAFDALGLVYRESGEAPMPIVAPMSLSELRSLLGAIDPEALSPRAAELYARLSGLGRGAGEGSSLRARAGLSAGFDARFRSDEAIGWTGESADRPSLLKLPLGFDLGDIATGYADLELREGYWASTLGSSDLGGHRNWTNFPDDYGYVDISIPRRAGLSFGGEAWNFQIARDRVDMDAADLGATTVSRFLDRVDYARLSFFSPRFAWRSMVLQLQSLPITLATTSDGKTVDGTRGSSVPRYLYLHRLDWKPFPNLSFGFTEAALVAQPLELRFLNPLVSFHALSAWKNYGDGDDSVGSLLGLDLGWTPFRGARVYGQLSTNQIKTPFPSEAGSLQPDSYSIVSGLEWSVPAGSGFLGAKLEGYYASPWFATLYGRDWSFLSLRRELVAPDGWTWSKGDILSWLGSPYGRDAAVAKLEASYSSPGAWSLAAEYRFAALGENSLDPGERWSGDWYTEDWQLVKANSKTHAPSGTPIYEQSLSLRGSLSSGPWSLGGLVAGKLRLNDGHAKGRARAGVEATLSVERAIF